MQARVEMPMTEEDVQVVAKPHRRVFTAEYQRRILKAADACTTPGAIGARDEEGATVYILDM